MIELSTKKARSVAKEFLGNLGQFCDLITISGSIRRGEKHHSIIDLVCIPKLDKKRKTINRVFGGFGRIIESKPTYIMIWHNNQIKVRLIFATPQNIGMVLIQNTGPASLNKKINRLICEKGFTLVGGIARQGSERDLFNAGNLIEQPFPNEMSVFRFLEMPYHPPTKR